MKCASLPLAMLREFICSQLKKSLRTIYNAIQQKKKKRKISFDIQPGSSQQFNSTQICSARISKYHIVLILKAHILVMTKNFFLTVCFNFFLAVAFQPTLI